MDVYQRKESFNGNTQRRKLVKKNPSHSYTRSSAGFDKTDSAGLDAQSLDSRSSSHSLKRAPSAPPIRSNPATASSGASSPRILGVAQTQRSNVSPILPQGDYNDLGFPAQQNQYGGLPHRAKGSSNSPVEPASQRANEDFIGAPFDAAAILRRMDTPAISAPQTSIPQRSNLPPTLVKAGTDLSANPTLRSSASFSTMDPSIAEKTQGGRSATENQSIAPNRYSDEGKEPKSATQRRKGGFTGFMNSLVGSQKKPTISAPENPVHVTHVGYDSVTGQFTVSSHPLQRSSISYDIIAYCLIVYRVSRKSGSD